MTAALRPSAPRPSAPRPHGPRRHAPRPDAPRPDAPRYADASRAGVLLGCVLLASFVVADRGLGASGAFASVVGALLDRGAPDLVSGYPALADRLPQGGNPLSAWVVWEMLGVAIGAALSARLAGRWGRAAHRDAPAPGRGGALAGGILMGVGARLAYGCTSGLALSGGALLATGAWLFIAIAFTTAIGVSLLLRGSRGAAA